MQQHTTVKIKINFSIYTSKTWFKMYLKKCSINKRTTKYACRLSAALMYIVRSCKGKRKWLFALTRPVRVCNGYIYPGSLQKVFSALATLQLSLCESAWQAVYKWMPLVLGTDVFWLAGESINQALGSSEAQHREIEAFCLGQSAVCPCWLTICQTRARFSVLLTLTGGSII